MKTSIFAMAAAIAAANAHTIFYSAEINGADQGQLVGVRAPSSNQYVSDVTSADMACNTGLQTPVTTAVLDIAAGDSFGTVWGHVIGGAQYSGDSDNPIASSHKGPIQIYMAKVTDASTDTGAGLSWFKVASEGLDTTTGTWGVDSMIAGNGVWNFTVPDLASGDYLVKAEIIALHSAGSSGGAQFYTSCAGVKVTGSGTCSPTADVKFPGTYSASDPGILISIYGNTGSPDNGGKAYTAPGGDVISCGSSSGSSSSAVATSAAATTAASSSTVAPAATSAASTSAAATSAVATSAVATSAASSSSTVAPVATSAPAATSVSSAVAVPTTLATSTSAAPAATSAPADDDECEA